MWARSTPFAWNVVVARGNKRGRGKNFARNGFGSGRGSSFCVQNGGSPLIGPAKQLCDTTQIKTRAKISLCHCCNGITSNITLPRQPASFNGKMRNECRASIGAVRLIRRTFSHR